jgi:hypothetical protein
MQHLLLFVFRLSACKATTPSIRHWPPSQNLKRLRTGSSNHDMLGCKKRKRKSPAAGPICRHATPGFHVPALLYRAAARAAASTSAICFGDRVESGGSGPVSVALVVCSAVLRSPCNQFVGIDIWRGALSHQPAPGQPGIIIVCSCGPCLCDTSS